MSNKDLVFVKGKNLFDKNKIVAGYILAQDGSIAPPNNLEASSDYIAIESSNPYTFSVSNYTVPTGGSMWLAISLFDSNKNIIARYADYNISSITVTASQTVNAKYIRVSYRYNDSNIKCQLEYGSTATVYEPYQEKKIMIKNKNGVYEEFYNENENKLSSNIIWQGNHYTKGSNATQHFGKPLEDGKLYVFYAKGLSVNFIQTIPFIAGINNYVQQSYYDGTTVVRWRIMINSDKTGFYLDDSSINMQANTAIISCIKVDN